MFSLRDIRDRTGGTLLREKAGATPSGCCVDSRRVAPGDLFFALRGARTDGRAFLDDAFRRGAIGAVVSEPGAIPASAHDVLVVPDVLAALQGLARAWREQLLVPLVGITGSNGKTTTRGLLSHLLSGTFDVYTPPANYNTEIGLPAALASMPLDATVGVFELGTEKRGDIAYLAELLRPTLVILTSVGESHLGGLGTLDAVAREKWSLIDALPDDAGAFVNVDSPFLRDLAATRRRPGVETVGLTCGEIRGSVLHAVPHLVLDVAVPPMRIETRLVGEYNATNVLLAAACAHRLGVPPDRIEERAASFVPVERRMQPRRAPFGVLLDDTYNANPLSMAAAVRTLGIYGGKGATRLFVFGDMLGLGGVSEARHAEVVQLALACEIDEIVPAGERAAAACRRIADVRIARVDPAHLTEHLVARLRGATDAVVLIKGSRDLALDRLADEILRRLGQAT